MKKIIITENQFNRIFKNNLLSEDGNIPTIGGSNVPEATSSENKITSTVSDSNGNKKMGKPTTSDKVGKAMNNSNVYGTTVGGYKTVNLK